MIADRAALQHGGNDPALEGEHAVESAVESLSPKMTAVLGCHQSGDDANETSLRYRARCKNVPGGPRFEDREVAFGRHQPDREERYQAERRGELLTEMIGEKVHFPTAPIRAGSGNDEGWLRCRCPVSTRGEILRLSPRSSTCGRRGFAKAFPIGNREPAEVSEPVANRNATDGVRSPRQLVSDRGQTQLPQIGKRRVADEPGCAPCREHSHFAKER
jgi:hypothetical protein